MEIDSNHVNAQGGVWMLIHERMIKYRDGEPQLGKEKHTDITRTKGLQELVLVHQIHLASHSSYLVLVL